MELHSGLPYWIVKNRLFDYYHPLRTDLSTDVAVIGAGITGALVAHELCRAGLDCCVIDKRSIATGSSAASTALLQYEIDVPLHRLAALIGETEAVAAYRACLRSISDLERLLERTGVDADFERVPSIFYAADSEGMELVEREFGLRRHYDLPAAMLSRRELFESYGMRTPAGALLNRESAQVDAYKAAVGLFRYHMQRSGLEVYTHTEIVRCEADSEGCRLFTGDGRTVRCRYAVVAAGFEAGRFLPEKVMKLTSTYALISHPVDERRLWPERALIWETSDPYLYIRTSGANRIIVGGEDEDFSDPERRDKLLRKKTEVLESKFRQLLPEVPFAPEMAWCGTFSTTDDGLPFIGARKAGDRIYFDLGYGGNGITFSVIGAQIIRRALSGTPDEFDDVFGFGRLGKR